LPLSDEAVALLKSLPRFLTNDFVFTFGGGKPVNSFSQHKKVLDRFMAEELGHEPDSFAAHDLRRTVRSRLSPLTTEHLARGDGGTVRGTRSVGAQWCSIVSPGCKNCYAPRWAANLHHRHPVHADVTERRGSKAVFNGKLTVLPLGHDNWTWPLTWPGQKHPLLGDGEPSLIFVGAMSDLFHEERHQSVIDQVIATMVASRHIGLLLTRRAKRTVAYFFAPFPEMLLRCRKQKLWLGFSAERQQEFDARYPTCAGLRPAVGPFSSLSLRCSGRCGCRRTSSATASASGASLLARRVAARATWTPTGRALFGISAPRPPSRSSCCK